MTNEERDKLINSILPDTVKGQQRPAENLNPDMPYSTDFPQLINKDPASADVFNLINRQLLSNDKNLNDNKADKTYVDKKVADLVNGAPEQLDTLQELSKALNNDKDYATTVNNALAEKLGKTEKAVSAETADNATRADTAGTADSAKVADSANSLEGYPLSHGGDSTFGKVPLIGTDGVLEIGQYIDFHSENGDGQDYSTRIMSLNTGTLDISGGIRVGTFISRYLNTSFLQIMGGTTYNTGAHLSLSANSDIMYGSGSFALVSALAGKPQKALIGKLDGSLIWNGTDIAGAGIVSQQLSQEASYIKYANGLLVQFGMMEVQGYSGTKMYVKTLPISFKATYSLQATLGYPNTDRVSSVQAETDLTYIKLYIHNFINDYNSPVYYCNWLMIGTWK